MKNFYDKGIFSALPSQPPLTITSRKIFCKYFQIVFLLFSVIVSLLSLVINSQATALSVSLYWGFVVLPLTEFWLTSSTILIGPMVLTGCHFLLFIGLVSQFQLWRWHYLELYTGIFFYYRISINGVVGLNIILFGLLEYGIVHIIKSPMIAWALLLHAIWVNRILHWSRTRLKENLGQLIVMKKRIELERQLSEKLLTNSLGYKIFSTSRSTKFPLTPNPTPSTSEAKILSSCIERNIVSTSNQASFRFLMDILKSEKVGKQSCSLIAIKQIFCDSDECVAESTIHRNRVNQMLNYLSKKHKITIMKKFGDVYIGCIGFFEDKDNWGPFEESWGSPEENAKHTMQMACDLFNIGAKYNINFVCAIDYGRVVAGFIDGILSFDMFGPEILWVLSVCESSCSKKIIISKSVHVLFSKSKKVFPYQFEEWHVQLPDRKDPEKAAALKNVEQYEIFASASAQHQSSFELSSSTVDSPELPWYILQQMFLLSRMGDYVLYPITPNIPKTPSNYLQYLLKVFTRPTHSSQQATLVPKKLNDIDLGWDPLASKTTGIPNSLDSTNLVKDRLVIEAILSELHEVILHSIFQNLSKDFPAYLASRVKVLFLLPFKCNNFDQKTTFLDDSKVPYTINESILYDAFPAPFTQEWKEFKDYLILLKKVISNFLIRYVAHQYIEIWNRYVPVVFKIVEYQRVRPTTQFENVASRHSLFVNKSLVETPRTFNSSLEEYVELDHLAHPPPGDWNSFKNRCHLPNYRYSDLIVYCTLSLLTYISLGIIFPSSGETHTAILKIGVYPFALCVMLTLWSSVVFDDKNFPPVVFCFLVGLKMFMTCFFPMDNLPSLQTYLLFILLWTYFSLNQEIVYFTVDTIVTIIVVVYRNILFDKITTAPVDLPMIVGFILFFWVFSIITEYYTYICFLVEHTIIPHEIQVCKEEIELSRTICCNYVPQIPRPLSTEFYAPRRYRKCAILAFHIKAAESIPAVVDVHDVASLISFLYNFMDNCVSQFGLLRVSRFSGIHISAICEDEAFHKLRHSESAIPYIQRVVACVRYMQTKLKKFNTENSMNITLGVSLSHGSAYLGLMGDANNLQFDISCRARDEAFYMCIRQTNSLVVSDAYYDEINRLRDVSNCVYTVLDCKLPSHFICQTWYDVELNSGYFGAVARELEDYNYVGFLGEGGNGSVHLLVDKISKVQVAVKGIHWGMGRSSSIQHIRRELVILQQLQHPNIVNFKFCIIRRAKIYIVMEYIRGGTLRQIIAEHKPSLVDLKVWFAQLVSALGYLHDHGIMHRDVKPSNCMVDTFGRLKLTDFGLALVKEENSEPDPAFYHQSETDSSEKSEPQILALATATRRLLQNIFPVRENHDIISHKSKEKGSILIVDSAKYRLNQNVSLLQQAFTVWSANNDDEAIDLLSNRSSHKIDIVLIDLNSDENTAGWGFLSELWRNEEWKDTPVIVLTNSNEVNFNSSLWTNRLPGISQRPRLILNHPFDFQANRYYFQMLCRLEMTSTVVRDPKQSTLRKVFHGTIFDNMFENVYRKRFQRPGTKSIDETTKTPLKKGKIQGSGLVGTIHYMAPEMIQGRETYSEGVDWWSCGVLIFECITLKRLFEGSSQALVTRDIVHCDVPKRLKLFEDLLDPTSHDLLLHILEKDPDLRYGEDEIKSHPFFNNLLLPTQTTFTHKVYSTPATNHLLLDATCVTLPSDFNSLSQSQSVYKPREMTTIQKVSEDLHEKRKIAFFSEQEVPKSRISNSKAKDTSSKNLFHLPQLEEGYVESESASQPQQVLESFGSSINY